MNDFPLLIYSKKSFQEVELKDRLPDIITKNNSIIK